MAGLVGLGVFALRRRPAPLAAVAAGCAVLPLLLIAVSASLHHPVWMPRYVLWGAPALFVLAAQGLGLVPSRLQLPALGAAGLILLVNLLPYYHDETKPRWDLAAAIIAADARAHDIILVNDTWAADVCEFFLAREKRSPHSFALSSDVAAASTALAAGHRVWAVAGPVGQSGGSVRASFERRLAVLGDPAAQIAAGREIVVDRFDPKPGTPLADSTRSGPSG
jgi:hypothetical protein